MTTDFFYANLPLLENFIDITDSQNFKSVPRDWYVVISDIIGSTQAIESGRYKEVNLLGACSIVAVLNIAGNLDIPFVFGGDGATLLIPPSLFALAREALLATSQLARGEFGMELRVGAVPMSDVRVNDYDVKLAKLKVSENYYQAIFTGDGLTYATELIKHSNTSQFYLYQNPTDKAKADLSNLECRWQDIPSKYGETISLIVKATSNQQNLANLTYRAIIEKIDTIYGSEEVLNPVDENYLNLGFSYQNLSPETRLCAQSNKLSHRMLYFAKICLENLLGWLLMKLKVTLPDGDWGAYKLNAIAATDYRKFDDILRMVIAGNEVQRKQLTDYLEKNYKQGKLVYGLHISDRALMTCLVFERHGRQVHFVDGADGGYAVAAKDMKDRLKLIADS
ncbi:MULTISPECIES: DUF3095 domain-containing protein [unclassified Moorena]|uniref:DUF3095 domain-containing protein n=1 Tax=unclassified Moorena TaxID=2683338 RepID=UPI0013BBDF24|nr:MULTISPECIES: DUF3095 domain-containing protein [unclassified Moorena]NEQ05900.1 DUF3095 domain-containing protein [Moorena sp. SIO4E2]NER85977.1 DUF3095 domain-containing protein [Moorena sp. SIO3A2]NES43417.1 DUF3095 domain-containing protein [Moorena sp. SIO2C4]NES84874.1 DUF3095 domain-containing protein [Moorena sp. SIO2B7]